MSEYLYAYTHDRQRCLPLRKRVHMISRLSQVNRRSESASPESALDSVTGGAEREVPVSTNSDNRTSFPSHACALHDSRHDSSTGFPATSVETTGIISPTSATSTGRDGPIGSKDSASVDQVPYDFGLGRAIDVCGVNYTNKGSSGLVKR